MQKLRIQINIDTIATVIGVGVDNYLQLARY